MKTMLSLLILTILTTALPLLAQEGDESTAIQDAIAEIRGKPFRSPVPAEKQSLEDFRAYLERELDRQIPPEISRDYDAIVRALGLYRGPRIDDYRAMATSVMLSQAAAYYDPGTGTFYEVMGGFPDIARRGIWAHELMHGLQDQYYDLDDYILDHATGGPLNEDALLARQCVVEGEAMYVMTLFSAYDMLGMVPDRSLLGPAIAIQASMSAESLKGAMASQGDLLDMGDDMERAMAAMDDIPPFMIETLVGAYLKGQAFVYEVQAGGWGAVDSLFVTPPASTEQILHPGRWRDGDVPAPMTWPDGLADRFDGWRLMRDDVMGELQWRLVFDAYDTPDGNTAAEGWDGDCYAVFMDDDGRTFTLMATYWDSEVDAAEFVAAYDKVQEAKDLHDGAVRRIFHEGMFVGIVEGGTADLEPAGLAAVAGTLPE